MKKVKLGSSSLMVSEVCLGSMTWGIQNTFEDAKQQIEYALECGINFIDTAEMYPVPPNKETSGDTERIIGRWLLDNQDRREDIILASKVSGPGVPWLRQGSELNGAAIKSALDASLQRLKTDYLDLYQLHWPNRAHPHFGRHWLGTTDFSDTDIEKEQEGMLEILRALDDCVKAGKIRYCGLSDDTPWGINEYARLSKQHDLPKMVSVQNEFNLLHLKDWPYVMESCAFHDMAYLPWSPIAGGALSGKYANGQRPEGCRWTMVQRHGLFRDTSLAHEAIASYQEIANRHKLSLVQLALAWLYQLQPVTATIIGATSMEQLKEDIGAYKVALSEEILAEIDAVIKRYPLPF